MTRCILQRRLAQRLCSCGPSDGGMVPAVSLRLQEISFRRASQHGHKLRGSKPSKEGFLRRLDPSMLQNAADVLGEGSGHRHRARPPVSAEIRALVSRMAAANPTGGRPQNPGGALEGGHRRGGPHRLPATPHAWAGISGAAEPALSGRAGARSGQSVGTPPPTDAPPTRARRGQRVRTTIRRGKARYGTGLIGPKNLRAWSQKPEGSASKT